MIGVINSLEWVSPQYSRGEVRRAGSVLIDPHAQIEDRDRAYSIMNNWRTSHGFPLNTFQVGLRAKSKQISPDALVAQRLKRAPSIISKLERFPKMDLSRMQDLGGCRAIMPSIGDVYELLENYNESQFKHKRLNIKDYIKNPKESGYRGIHLIYSYNSDRQTTYNKLQIEIQMRTQVQHAWATAVETAGTFSNQALKSSQGGEDWLRYFSLTASVFAMLEGQTIVPGTSDNLKTLKKEIKQLDNRLNIRNMLMSYRQVIKITEFAKKTSGRSQSLYYLIQLNPNNGNMIIEEYRQSELDMASKAYLDLEEKASGDSALIALVSTSSIDSLRVAYPNYFLDTEKFLNILDSI